MKLITGYQGLKKKYFKNTDEDSDKKKKLKSNSRTYKNSGTSLKDQICKS